MRNYIVQFIIQTQPGMEGFQLHRTHRDIVAKDAIEAFKIGHGMIPEVVHWWNTNKPAQETEAEECQVVCSYPATADTFMS